MGSIIGSVLGSCATGILCKACSGCSGHKTGVMSRLPYIFLFFLSGIFSIFMSLYGEEALHLPFGYTAQACNSGKCTGNGSVYRVSFLLFIFELLHVLIIGGGGISFQWVWFPLKCIVFAISLTLTFVLGDDKTSNSFFNGYADYFARYTSGIYLLIQILILITWGYKINDYLQEKGNGFDVNRLDQDQDEDESPHQCNGYFWTLGISSFGLYLLSLILCICFFSWYASGSSCGTHRTLIGITIVLCAASAVISGIRGNGSFFVSAIISFYCTFLMFSALQSDDNDECNKLNGNRNTASLWIGYIMTFLAIFYSAIRADTIGLLWNEDESVASSDDHKIDFTLMDESENDNDGKVRKEDEDSKDNKSDDVDENEDLPPKQVQKISNVYFHFIMMLAACYMAMLFSNWGTSTQSITTTGKESMIINIITQYVTVFLFWWTLIAPVVFPSRFSDSIIE